MESLKESLLKNINQGDNDVKNLRLIEEWLDTHALDDNSSNSRHDGAGGMRFRQDTIFESGKYKIHSNGTLDILTDVAVFLDKGDETFPEYIKFGKIDGSFIVSHQAATNTDGYIQDARNLHPYYIGGEKNKLKNLKNFPKYIKGVLRIYGPNLESLKGDCVSCGCLDITAPMLKSLDGMPTVSGHVRYGKSVDLRGMDSLKEVDLSYMNKMENIRLELGNISKIKLPGVIDSLTVIIYSAFLHTKWLDGVEVTRDIKIMHHHDFCGKKELKALGFNPKPGSRVYYFKSEHRPISWFKDKL